MNRSVLAAAALLTTSGLAHADVIYATAYRGEGGIYEIDVDALTSTRVSTVTKAWSLASGDDASTLYYTSSNGNLQELDLETGDVTSIGGRFSNNSLARGADGYLYSGTWSSGDLLRIDPETGDSVSMGSTGLTGFAGDLAPGASGELYGISRANDVVSIDPTTGAVTASVNLSGEVDAWGIATTYDGRLWVTAASSLYQYDLSTNTLTYMMDMGFDAYDLASTPGVTYDTYAVPAPATAVLMAGGLIAIPRRKRR